MKNDGDGIYAFRTLGSHPNSPVPAIGQCVPLSPRLPRLPFSSVIPKDPFTLPRGSISGNAKPWQIIGDVNYFQNLNRCNFNLRMEPLPVCVNLLLCVYEKVGQYSQQSRRDISLGLFCITTKKLPVFSFPSVIMLPLHCFYIFSQTPSMYFTWFNSWSAFFHVFFCFIVLFKESFPFL